MAASLSGNLMLHVPNSADAHIEKCLEHYLSFTLLGLSSTDTFVDIAAAGSPFSDSASPPSWFDGLIVLIYRIRKVFMVTT